MSRGRAFGATAASFCLQFFCLSIFLSFVFDAVRGSPAHSPLNLVAEDPVQFVVLDELGMGPLRFEASFVK
jgi:hypothetical protein